ncbi:MAG: S8 family serine peptidase, partial [Flavobacteriales bacterium]
YIDDVHGWSFIGGAKGDVEADNLEFTRIYRELHKKYANVNQVNLTSKEQKAEYKRYEEMKNQMEKRVEEATSNSLQYLMIAAMYTRADEMLKRYFKSESITMEMLAEVPAADSMQQSAAMIANALENGFYNQIGSIAEYAESLQNQVETQLNIDFDPRDLVGDNYADVNERNYGNNHIDGPASEHGTHVGGCVGASWNGKGAAGVCNNARLMVIRCVPDGDERDKDVANAIRYAVDNGAKIINMSFGKSFSPQKQAVDEAIRYAESKGVLLIHAAGNDFKNTDKEANFPTDHYDAGGTCSTWMEIGASSGDMNMLSADFSNYGKKNVDVFSPGVDIYNSVPGQKYEAMS